MDVVIYKDDSYTITIDFYIKPAVVSLISNDSVLLKIDVNLEYISGDKKYFDALTKWLVDVEKKLEDIVWEWNNGNDDFELIDDKFVM